MSRAAEHHKATSPKSLGIFIVTCSTSRYNELRSGGKLEDESGDIIEKLALSAGHVIKGRIIINDSRSMIQRKAKQALANDQVDAVIITGGTGLSPRDVTIEAIRPMITKEITGFGELFRKLSFDRIGSPAMLSRALAGLVGGKAVFCLPGSPGAVQTSMEHLILPELGHIIRVSRER
jgi:molybdenum cofactor biosynthesis protein B